MIPGMPNWAKSTTEPGVVMGPIGLISSAPYPKPLGYSFGPINVSDTSKGLLDAYWTAYLSGGSIKLAVKRTVGDEWQPVATLFDQPEVPDDIKLAFDQSGKPMVLMQVRGQLVLWWYDPVAANNVKADLGPAFSGVIALDYPKLDNVVQSDVYIYYVDANGELYYRIQRERFATEHHSSKLAARSILVALNYLTDRTVQLTIDQEKPVS